MTVRLPARAAEASAPPAVMLGPVTLVSDDEGQWAEMQEPVARLALTGSLMALVAGAGFEPATFGL